MLNLKLQNQAAFMTHSKGLLLVLLFFCTSLTAYNQIVIVQQSNAQALAQKLVGDGVTISNVTINASPLATGFFYNQGSLTLGMDSGIVLSSGRVLTQGLQYGINSPANTLASTTLNTNGDNSLSSLVNQPTFDATILEFDFVPLGDTIQFRYVFSSEEYPDFNCTIYNDVFAFFITGPGITGTKNIALVPGTNIPVAISSVNNGVPGFSGNIGICNAMGPGSPFTQLFVNNSTSPFFSHNGHTKVFIAQSRVTPCQTYHLKIAIADAFDHSLDSGVFLEARSLTSDPIHIESSLPVINGLPYLVEGCQSGGIKILRSRKSPESQTVNLTFAGTAINGVDVQLIAPTILIPANDSIGFVDVIPIVDNLPEGTEFLKIYVSNGCALANNYYLDSIIIQVRDYDTLTLQPHNTVNICRGGSVQMTATSNFSNYQWSPVTGVSNPTSSSPLITPTANLTTYYLTAGLGTCQARDSVTLRVKDLELLSVTQVNCKDGNTGQIKVSGGSEWKAPVQYNIGNGAYGADSTFSNLAVGNYIVHVKDLTGCTDSMQVSVLQKYPDLLVADSSVSAACNGSNGAIFLSGNGGLLPYQYALDAGTYSTTSNLTLTSGSHTISIKDSNGCITTKPVVIKKDSVISFTITPNKDACNGSSSAYLYIQAQGGSGLYQYSSDGLNFQLPDSLLVSTNVVIVTVKDNKGCVSTQSVNLPLNQAVFINAGNDTTICEGRSVHFNTLTNANTFNWVSHPSLSSTSVADPVATPVQTVTYYVTAVKDVCTVKDTITVSVLAAPIANAGVDSTICFGKSITLQGSGGQQYFWQPAGQFTNPSSSSPVVKPTQAVNYYYLSIIGANGCPSLKNDTVKVNLTPAVQVFAGHDTIISIGEPLQLHGVDLANSGVTQYIWSPSTGLSNPAIANPVLITNRDMVYTLTMMTPDGCEGSDQISIKAYEGPQIYVPSGFTPNGDGKNDVLKPITIGMKEFHYFRVFNRWGQLVFSSTTEKKGWDGTIAGSKQNTGTFVWMVEMVDFKGNIQYRQGVTTLIR
jgi:gliding motility-associated-like protein